MRLIFFDLDRVLTPQSHVLHIAQQIGKKKEFKRLFKGNVGGNTGLEWIVKQGVTFLEGHDPPIFKEIAKKMQIIEHGQEVVDELKRNEYHPIIITNGFYEIAKGFGEKIGIEEAYGNKAERKNGVFTGNISSELLTLKSKGDTVRRILKEKEPEVSVSVGDDENDWFMFRETDFSILFNPTPTILTKIRSFKKKKGTKELTKFINLIVANDDLGLILPFLVPKPDLFPKTVNMERKIVR
ncbi:MAG: HAD-IB family phosphatase [Euryarchaeota archaeon]|nr:HAD-IB family phosphatase [Euryarchaeota archaeon]